MAFIKVFSLDFLIFISIIDFKVMVILVVLSVVVSVPMSNVTVDLAAMRQSAPEFQREVQRPQS